MGFNITVYSIRLKYVDEEMAKIKGHVTEEDQTTQKRYINNCSKRKFVVPVISQKCQMSCCF